ncbi:MAG: PilZ domain-containing protein [Holophaga sp.]|nr:PilZ domain-containing protein [Holophaga sp.]
METSNQREFTRVPINVRAEVKGGGFVITSSTTRSLSLKGMFVACTEQVPVGTECEITLFLGDGDIQIQTEGPVVHCYPDGIALQFTRILGIESFEHLRNLVLYNAPDPDAVENEFNTSTGIHRKG